MAQVEGIVPSLETSHAIWAGMKTAGAMKVDETLIIYLDGKGDKDLQVVADRLRY